MSKEDGPAAASKAKPRLWINDGHGVFTDITVSSGLSEAGPENHGATVADVDGDGDLDLIIANEYDANRLFINRFAEEGIVSFVEEAAARGIADADSYGIQPVAIGENVDPSDVNQPTFKLRSSANSLTRLPPPSTLT